MNTSRTRGQHTLVKGHNWSQPATIGHTEYAWTPARMRRYGHTVELLPSKPARFKSKVGGGLRGCVDGFSYKARRRLMRTISRINTGQLGCMGFVTLTYHENWRGRDIKRDLNNYIKLQMAISSGNIPAQKQEIDFSQWGEVEVQKLTRINRITGQRLQQAWQTIPHVTQFDSADITDLDSYRKRLKTKAAERDIKVTFLPFLMKAVTTVLKEMPEFNSSLDHTDQNLVLKNYYHLGIAVDTPFGLTVPVVRDVDQKSIIDLSSELMDLSSRAREKKLKPDEIRGGTFTISSLGGIGGTGFSPIVNPPEVAIMGVSRSAWKQVYDKATGEFKTRFIMPFSLSYDHRVIDGASAATFTSRFASVLCDLSYFKN